MHRAFRRATPASQWSEVDKYSVLFCSRMCAELWHRSPTARQTLRPFAGWVSHAHFNHAFIDGKLRGGGFRSDDNTACAVRLWRWRGCWCLLLCLVCICGNLDARCCPLDEPQHMVGNNQPRRHVIEHAIHTITHIHKQKRESSAVRTVTEWEDATPDDRPTTSLGRLLMSAYVCVYVRIWVCSLSDAFISLFIDFPSGSTTKNNHRRVYFMCGWLERMDNKQLPHVTSTCTHRLHVLWSIDDILCICVRSVQRNVPTEHRVVFRFMCNVRFACWPVPIHYVNGSMHIQYIYNSSSHSVHSIVMVLVVSNRQHQRNSLIMVCYVWHIGTESEQLWMFEVWMIYAYWCECGKRMYLHIRVCSGK